MKKISLILVLGFVVLYVPILSASTHSEPIYTSRDIEILRSRAKQDDAVAQYHLGYAYANGNIVAKDERERRIGIAKQRRMNMQKRHNNYKRLETISISWKGNLPIV